MIKQQRAAKHWCYLSIASESGVVEQEVSAEEHHDGVINTQNGPVDEGGPLQQSVLGNISVTNTAVNIVTHSGYFTLLIHTALH